MNLRHRFQNRGQMAKDLAAPASRQQGDPGPVQREVVLAPKLLPGYRRLYQPGQRVPDVLCAYTVLPKKRLLKRKDA
jgi:hypothetical protein